MIYDRATFAAALGNARSAPTPVPTVREFIRGVLRELDVTSEGAFGVIEEAALLLDTMGDADHRLLALVQDVVALLAQASSDDAAESMLRLVAERHRVSTVLEKHLANVISRTAFLSFAAEQLWPPEMRRKITRISRDELQQLSKHLSALEIVEIERLLLTP
jgi:hypothetical protein